MKIKPFMVFGTLNESTMILLGLNTVLWCLVIGFNITGEI